MLCEHIRAVAFEKFTVSPLVRVVNYRAKPVIDDTA